MVEEEDAKGDFSEKGVAFAGKDAENENEAWKR